MKIWTQQEFEQTSTLTGEIMLGTGDFRQVDFGGKSGLTFGPQSIIGRHAHVGVACEIGHHSEIGEGFFADGNLTIGAQCRFGRDARLGDIAKIGWGTSFGDGPQIGEGAVIEDGVTLPPRCTLFGVTSADGRTLVKLSPVVGRTLYAFAARDAVWVCMPQMRRTLEEFEDFAVDQATMQSLTAARAYTGEGHQLLAAAKYIRARFSLQGLCAAFRQSGK